MAIARSGNDVEKIKIQIKLNLINHPDTPEDLRVKLWGELKQQYEVITDINLLLLTAASRCDFSSIKDALKSKADIHYKNADNMNAVWQVVCNVKKENLNIAMTILKFLLEKNVDPNVIPTKEGCRFSPLSLAANHGFEELVALLLEYKADPNLKNLEHGTFPLHIAAQNNFHNVARRLINKGADVNGKSMQNATPLHFAVATASSAMVRLLIENKADVNACNKFNESVALFAAIRTREPTQWKKEFYLIWKVLFSASPCINLNISSINNSCALQAATEKNNLTLANLLLSNGARVNTRVLITKGCKGTLLHHAIQHFCSLPIIELLIAHEADVNAQDDEKVTPLARAAIRGDEQVVSFLMKKGANVNVKEGMPPLHAAVLSKKPALVELLLRQPGIVVDQIYERNSALQRAIEEESLQMVKALIGKGALNNESEFSVAITTAFQVYCENQSKVTETQALQFVSRSVANKNLQNSTEGGAPPFEFQDETQSGGNAIINLLIQKKFGARYILNKVEKIKVHTSALDYYVFDLYDTVNDNIIDPSKVPAQGESSRKFLTERGYTPQQIEELKKSAVSSEAASSSTSRSVVKDYTKITWLNGQLNMKDMPKIKQIINADNENCFSLIVEANLPKKLDADELNKFKAVSNQFAAEGNSQGLKRLKGNGETSLMLNGENRNICFSHEIKIANKSRILCFPLLSDDEKHTLYIGAVYSSDGLHKKNLSFFTDRKHKIEINLTSAKVNAAKSASPIAKK